ncbi:MAG: class II aldolase/adducin family protein [Treponema sp.]|nr:class II aldolase/adducin family protein [Treponema sp.]
MAYTESDARALVIRAGLRLVETGLIARTWGNISARISDTQFVITPSGRAYETLTPEELVVVNTDDCSYSGNIKPSSEKGVHADAYRLRPDVNFVIHTHQEAATIAGLAGQALSGYDSASGQLLGPCVPCAAYGISSTKKLRKNVAAAVAANPGSNAVLMIHHGVLCIGKTFENAFAASSALEDVCRKKIEADCGKKFVPGIDAGAGRIVESCRTGNVFRLTENDADREFNLDALPSDITGEAAVHAAVYLKFGGISYIMHVFDRDILSVCAKRKTLKPRIDDFAQIAGVNVRCVSGGRLPEAAAGKLAGRNAVLIERNGALCTGKEKGDAEAVHLILLKSCRAELYASYVKCSGPLGPLDAFLQRLIYVKKYSKQKTAERN